jgi:uncharacterized membrane protein
MEHRVTATVAAPTDAVWRLFIDIERWPEMTASVLEVRRTDSGPVQVGSEAIVRQPGLIRARWRVTEIEPGRSFVWETKVAGVTAVGGHLVEQDGDHAVITLTLRQHGPLAPLLAALTSRMTKKNIALELEGFRRTAESESVG